MAISIAIKPNLSAFREATPDEIAEAVIKVLPAGALSSSDHALIAAALLENFWVVPR
jgi:hypothetical protein